MRFWNFIQNTKDENDIQLRIEGDIISDDDVWFYEWFGLVATSPNAFKTALGEHADKDITVWIDSFGGDVFAAAGIYNALKEHKGKVTVKVDGKAISAASIIAMAGSEIHMSPMSIMMIHNPLTYADGDSRVMRQTAGVLDEVKETLINAYQMKTKKSRNKISEMMDNETWMSAKTAMKEGFADGMLYVDKPETGDVVENAFLFSRLAIQNSIADSLKRFFEKNGSQIKGTLPEEDPLDEKLEETILPAPEPVISETDPLVVDTNGMDIRQSPVDLYRDKIKVNERKMKHEF